MKINQKKLAENQQDSFFYEGLIAETKDFNLFASGDIKLTCSCKPINDKEIDKCYEKDHFALNNWFEVVPKDYDACEMLFDCQESICNRYDTAIETLKDYQKEYDKTKANLLKIGSCDNTDHKGKCEDLKKVKMKEEFEGGKVLWCKACRERDSNFIDEFYIIL
jgi:hypothetical protein